MKPLRELIRTRDVDTVPPGWYRTREFAKREGYGARDGKFYEVLKFGLEEGLVECRKFTVRTINGAKAIAHYRRVK